MITFFKGMIVFFISLSPLLLFYNKVNFWRWAKGNTYIALEGDVNNYNFIHNLVTRLNHLYEILILQMHNFKIFNVLLFLSSFLFLIYILFNNKALIVSKQKICFLLSIFVFTIIVSSFTFSDLYWGHLFVLSPYRCLIVGLAIYIFLQGQRSLVIYSCVGAFLAAHIFLNSYCYINERMLWQNRLEGGSVINIQKITKWFLSNNIPWVYVVAVEGVGLGIREEIRFFSNLSMECSYREVKQDGIYAPRLYYKQNNKIKKILLPVKGFYQITNLL